jgi:hypothetical protein
LFSRHASPATRHTKNLENSFQLLLAEE